MAVIHLRENDGGAKCGCNVFYRREWNKETRKYEGPDIRRIRWQTLVYFSNENNPATCKRCLNKINRPITEAAPEIPTDKVFHRSFGYDMTINVFAAPIKKTAKGYICVILQPQLSGEAYAPGGGGTAAAGDTTDHSEKTFLMSLKKQIWDGGEYKYWTGGGHQWQLEDKNNIHYENHCD